MATKNVMSIVTKAALVDVMTIVMAHRISPATFKFLLSLLHEGLGLKISRIKKIKAKVEAETIWGMCLKTPIKRPPLKK